MSTPKYPTAKESQEKMFEAFKHILESIASLEKRIQACEIKLKTMRSE